jgi:hypothetical protein
MTHDSANSWRVRAGRIAADHLSNTDQTPFYTMSFYKIAFDNTGDSKFAWARRYGPTAEKMVLHGF